jgi:acyl carrier protein
VTFGDSERRRSVDAKERVGEFIRIEIMLGEATVEFTDETPILEEVIDSLGLMQLVSFLEEEYGVDIEDVDITSENFHSVTTIDRFIRTKLEEQQPQRA